MQFHWEMSELTLFWDMMSQNSHSQSDTQTLKLCEVILNSDIKSPAQHQPLSLHHYHCTATHCCHRHQQSHAPPHCHSAAAPMLPAPANTWKTMTTRWEGWRRVRRVGRRERETGKVTTMQCATHTLRHLFLSLYVVWWHGMQPTHCVSYFIPSMLFDDAVCNPHTALSISFSPCFLMMQHATHMPCQLFLSLHVVWWHDMQPTCCVIYLIPSMLFDDVACNPHATSSISFYFYSYIYS